MTDHTEMQIPDDVLAAAYEAMKDPTGGAAMCIARAILAERERCAMIAESHLNGRVAASKIRSVDK